LRGVVGRDVWSGKLEMVLEMEIRRESVKILRPAFSGLSQPGDVGPSGFGKALESVRLYAKLS